MGALSGRGFESRRLHNAHKSLTISDLCAFFLNGILKMYLNVGLKKISQAKQTHLD